MLLGELEPPVPGGRGRLQIEGGPRRADRFVQPASPGFWRCIADPVADGVGGAGDRKGELGSLRRDREPGEAIEGIDSIDLVAELLGERQALAVVATGVFVLAELEGNPRQAIERVGPRSAVADLVDLAETLLE